MDVPCRGCKKPLPADEIGWNRLRLCPDCRGKAMAEHALKTEKTDED